MTLIRKSATWPHLSHEQDEARVEEFRQEVRALEAQGWIMVPGTLRYREVDGGYFWLICEMLTPGDARTARLRRERLDLRRLKP